MPKNMHKNDNIDHGCPKYVIKLCNKNIIVFCMLIAVDGGHRAIIFSRLGGVQPGIYAEGLHFR